MNIRYFPVLCALFAVSALAPSAAVRAQQAATITPKHLHEQLGALEAAGYRPTGNDIDYPNNLAAAQARVAAAQVPEAASGYGPDSEATTQAGANAATPTVAR